MRHPVCINILSGDQNRWWSTCLSDISEQTKRWSTLCVVQFIHQWHGLHFPLCSYKIVQCIILYPHCLIHGLFWNTFTSTHTYYPFKLFFVLLQVSLMFFCSTPKYSFSLTKPSCSHKCGFVMTNRVTFPYKCYSFFFLCSFSVLEKLLWNCSFSSYTWLIDKLQ